LTLHDSRGRLVGAALDQEGSTGERVQVALKAGTRVIALWAERNRLMETPTTVGTPLYYAASDCAGQAFDAHGDPIPNVTRSLFASDVFVSDQKLWTLSGAAQTIQVNSQADETTGECMPVESFEYTGVPISEVADLRQFRPPFSIRGVTID
jgi:hypothetical protein